MDTICYVGNDFLHKLKKSVDEATELTPCGSFAGMAIYTSKYFPYKRQSDGKTVMGVILGGDKPILLIDSD